MTAHTAPISSNQTKNQSKNQPKYQSDNQPENQKLGRWALVAVGLAAAVGMTAAVVSVTGEGGTDTDPVSPTPVATESTITAEGSSYVPGADGSRVQAGQPDGSFQAPAVNVPAPSDQTGSGARLETGRPDGTWSVSQAPAAQADCHTSRFC